MEYQETRGETIARLAEARRVILRHIECGHPRIFTHLQWGGEIPNLYFNQSSYEIAEQRWVEWAQFEQELEDLLCDEYYVSMSSTQLTVTHAERRLLNPISIQFTRKRKDHRGTKNRAKVRKINLALRRIAKYKQSQGG